MSWSSRRGSFLLGSQTNALIVSEAQPPRSELFSEHTVLLPEVVDHIALLLMDPAGDRHKQKSQRMRQRRHHASVSEAPDARRPAG
jgi:hypothetical protein